MAVRTNLAWPWKAAVAIVCVAIGAGLWRWGFDPGQRDGFDRREIESRVETFAAAAAAAQREAEALRGQNLQLQSDLAITSGLQATLQKQQADLRQESAQIKDELAFFQQFFADSTKVPGVGIQRIAIDGNRSDVVRFSVLMVRGGATKADFEGELTLQAELVPLPTAAVNAGSRPVTFSLPGDAPETALPLKLKFKYYQRVEGTFRVPAGYQVHTVIARAYESGVASPRATRTLTLP